MIYLYEYDKGRMLNRMYVPRFGDRSSPAECQMWHPVFEIEYNHCGSRPKDRVRWRPDTVNLWVHLHF